MGLGIRQKGEKGRWWRKEEGQGRERSRDARTLLSGYRVSAWEDKDVLEMRGGDGYTTV